MIPLTRLDGSVVVVNADLIETVERHGDTVITLVSGTRFVVREDIAAITDAVVRFRGGIIGFIDRAAASRVGGDDGEPKHATVIPLSLASSASRVEGETD